MWRVDHVGRDSMYYEELRDGSWERLDLGGEMLVGRAHHVIYFGKKRSAGLRRERSQVMRGALARRRPGRSLPPKPHQDRSR